MADPEVMDHHAHPRAKKSGKHQNEAEGHKRMYAQLTDKDSHKNAGESDNRSNGQVDPTGDDNKSHPNRSNAENGVICQQISNDPR